MDFDPQFCESILERRRLGAYFSSVTHIACALKRSSNGWHAGPASAATLVSASAAMQLRAATIAQSTYQDGTTPIVMSPLEFMQRL